MPRRKVHLALHTEVEVMVEETIGEVAEIPEEEVEGEVETEEETGTEVMVVRQIIHALEYNQTTCTHSSRNLHYTII